MNLVMTDEPGFIMLGVVAPLEVDRSDPRR